jgi:DNA (cytosine-5)-methyltransferase 1
VKALLASSRDSAPRARRPRPLTAIDLFAGPGGMTTGLKGAGFSVIGAVEIDPVAVATYRANHRKVRMFCGDIRRLAAKRVMKQLRLKPGDLDLLAGCPPCQGFSTLRTLNGNLQVDDPRNDLIKDYVRFVRVLRPKAVLMENVPGLMRDPRMAIALATLERLGYPVKTGTRIANAVDFGVPQQRRRMVMTAVKGGSVAMPRFITTRVTVRTALAGMPKAGSSGDPLHDHGEHRTAAIRSLIRLIPKNGGSRLDLGPDLQLGCHQRTDGFYDIYGRMSWDRPAPTITSGCTNPSKGRFLHPSDHRAITLREAALLQAFPRHYRFDPTAGKEAIAAMIGNALPPPLVRAHAREIARTLRGRAAARYLAQ